MALRRPGVRIPLGPPALPGFWPGFAGVARLEECVLGKDEAVGSNPISGSWEVMPAQS